MPSYLVIVMVFVGQSGSGAARVDDGFKWLMESHFFQQLIIDSWLLESGI